MALEILFLQQHSQRYIMCDAIAIYIYIQDIHAHLHRHRGAFKLFFFYYFYSFYTIYFYFLHLTFIHHRGDGGTVVLPCPLLLVSYHWRWPLTLL